MILHPYPFRNQKIAIVGDFPREDDLSSGVPFSGKAGQELTRLLTEAGIARKDCWLTYACTHQPMKGFERVKDFLDVCVPKKEYVELCEAAGVSLRPPLTTGKYVPPEYYPGFYDLRRSLESLSPNLTIVLGALPLWALTNSSAIASVRGTVIDGPCGKILPTYPPDRVLAQWSSRVVVLVDLQKARREAEFKEVRKPRRQFWIDPSIEDLHLFTEVHLAGAKEISVDIECLGKQISMIGVSPHPSISLVVPFMDTRQPDLSYWRTEAEEVLALRWVKTLLQSKLVKITQNGIFDMQWIWKQLGFGLRGPYEDTMIRHHTMQPELQKGLGFLGSVYTNEASWKLMRKRTGEEEEKKDE